MNEAYVYKVSALTVGSTQLASVWNDISETLMQSNSETQMQSKHASISRKQLCRPQGHLVLVYGCRIFVLVD